jgi:hypothetical protein
MSKKIKKTHALPLVDKNPILKGLVKFSFKYLIKDNPKFDYLNASADYFAKFLERLKALSTMTIQDFRNNHSKALRCHPIDWQDTTENGFGLPQEEQLVDQPFQFSVSSNEYGRVIGFFIDDTFYIVWLDLRHLLYN